MTRQEPDRQTASSRQLGLGIALPSSLVLQLRSPQFASQFIPCPDDAMESRYCQWWLALSVRALITDIVVAELSSNDSENYFTRTLEDELDFMQIVSSGTRQKLTSPPGPLGSAS